MTILNETTLKLNGELYEFYKGSSVADSFIYWYIPFQLDSYCVSIYTKTLSLPEEKMTFIFIHIEEKDLWMALAKNK